MKNVLFTVSVIGLVLSISCSPSTRTQSVTDLPEKADQPHLTTPESLLDVAVSSLEPSARASAITPLILAEAGDNWAQRGLFDPSPWVQRAACQALITKKSYEHVLSYLNRSTDPYVRGEIAAELVHQGFPTGQLATLWSTSAPPLDIPLALPAAMLGDLEAIQRLGEALGAGAIALEPDFMAAVGQSGVEALIPFLQTGELEAEEEIRLAYAAARLHLGDSTANQTFRKAIGDNNPEVALEALDYLVEIQTSEATQLIRRGQASSDPAVRWYASLALTGRNEGNVNKITAAFDEENWEIRLWAARFAVTLISDPSADRKARQHASKTLLRAAKDPNPVIRKLAAKALPELESEQAEPLLQLLLSDTELDVRIAAAGAAIQVR